MAKKAKSAAKKLAKRARAAMAVEPRAPKKAAPKKAAPKKGKGKGRKPRSVPMAELQASHEQTIKELRREELDCCTDALNKAHAVMTNSAADPAEIAAAQTMYNTLQQDIQRLKSAA